LGDDESAIVVHDRGQLRVDGSPVCCYDPVASKRRAPMVDLVLAIVCLVHALLMLARALSALI
jgi:hypothetical protein